MFYQMTNQGSLPCHAGKASKDGAFLSIPKDGGGYSADAIPAPAGTLWVQVIGGSSANHAAAVALPTGASLVGEARHFWRAPTPADWQAVS